MQRSAVILAGGLGERLRPFTEIIPKPLLPIGEKSVLEIQIEVLKKYGFTRIYLATNYKSDYIENFFGDGKRYGVELYISRENIPLGTVGPLKLLENELKEPFIVMNGDILTLANLGDIYDFALSIDSLLTLAIKKVITPFNFGNVFFRGNYVTDVQEKPNIESYILAGIYVMKPGIMDLIPDNIRFDADALIKNMLDNRKPVAKFEFSELWLDIGQIESYEKAQEVYKSNFNK